MSNSTRRSSLILQKDGMVMVRGDSTRRIERVKTEFAAKYVLGAHTLGTGAFAEVKLGMNKSTRERVAIKKMSKKRMKKRDFSKIKREIEILRALDHNNIVQIYDAFSDPDYYYIVMEYAPNGDLFSAIVDDDEEFSEDNARKMVEKLAQALKYCKDNGVIHRDVKPENILLCDNGELKLADFNLSKKISLDDVHFSLLETECGTPNYVAPEVLQHKAYDYKCDIWSLGVIAFLLLSGGYLPFFPDNERAYDAKLQLLNKVRKGSWTFYPEEEWLKISEEGKDLVAKMMCANPEQRITYEEILAHSWLNPKKPEEADSEIMKLSNMKSFINTSSFTKLKQKIDTLKTENRFKTVSTVYEAVNTFYEIMTPAMSMTSDSLMEIDI